MIAVIKKLISIIIIRNIKKSLGVKKKRSINSTNIKLYIGLHVGLYRLYYLVYIMSKEKE